MDTYPIKMDIIINDIIIIIIIIITVNQAQQSKVLHI